MVETTLRVGAVLEISEKLKAVNRNIVIDLEDTIFFIDITMLIFNILKVIY